MTEPNLDWILQMSDDARAEWFASEPAERARRAAEWLSKWATERGLEKEAELVPAWDGVSSASKNPSWRAFADAVSDLKKLAATRARPKLEHWRLNHITLGWCRRDPVTNRSVASVVFEAGEWYGAAEHLDGNCGVLLPAYPSDALARAAVDEKLREFGWELG